MIDDDTWDVTFDVGCGMTKSGFTGDDAPRSASPTVCGTPKKKGVISGVFGMGESDHFFGYEANVKRGVLDLKYPIPFDNKSDVDYEVLEKLFYNIPFCELKYTPEYGALVLSSFHHMNDRSFEFLSQTLLESHGYLGLLVCDSSVLSMMSVGRNTGLSVDLGHGHIEVCAVYGGLPIHHSKLILEDRTAEKRTRIGGKLITDTLVSLLTSSGSFGIEEVPDLEIVNDVKEKLGFVHIPGSEKVKKIDSFSSILKDKSKSEKYRMEYERPYTQIPLIISCERFLAPEILFNPSLIGYKLPGIHELIKESVECCDPDLHSSLYQNIVLSGGTSMFEGIGERIEMELKKICDPKHAKHIKLALPAERKFSTWIGGSIMGSLEGAKRKYTTIKEFQEFGPSLIERKSQYCTRTNPNQHRILFLQRKDPEVDLKERVEYVLFECISDEEKFKVKSCDGSIVLAVSFKSLLHHL